jgi:endonuclease/exonuclease/phosphatase (EEP) superfamily protein YafD
MPASPALRVPVLAAATLAALASLLGFVDDRLWLAEVASSLRLQLLVAAIALVALAVLARSATGGGLAAVVLLVNAAVLVPLYTGGPAAAAGVARLRVAHVNMQGHSGDLDAFGRIVASERPDVMVVLEPSNGWLAEVSRHVWGYRILAGGGRWRPRVMVLATARLTDVRVPVTRGLPESALAFDVALDGRPVRVLAVHTLSPSTPGDRRGRDEELEAVAAWARQHRGSEIVLGDLNATPWSSVLRRLEDAGSLRNSADGFGAQPTWPSFAGPLGIPIDQLLHSSDLTVTDRDTRRGFGSEHRSLWVTVARAARE